MLKRKVGIVGCGYVSKWHLQAWKNNKDVQVVALCDINEDNLQDRASEFDIKRVYTNSEQMFEREDLDVVDVLTPLRSHRNIVISAAEHRFNVLCEKPFAPVLSEAKTMVEACEKNRVKLMIMQNFRWHPWFRAIKEILADGEIGSPFYANISQRIPYTIPAGPGGKVQLQHLQPFYLEFERLILLEMTSHYIDLMRFFFGEPKSIYAQIRHISPYVKGDDLTTVILNFEKTLAVIEDSWCTIGKQIHTSRTRIEGKKGTIYFDGEVEKAQLKIYKSHDIILSEIEASNYFLKSFQDAQRHFLKCIENDEIPQMSGKDNLKTLEVVLKAYESAKENQVIHLTSS